MILLTGATGYVGGRLLGRLESTGHRVRCLTRRPESLAAKVGPLTDVVGGDVLDRESLDVALKGVEVAYYLVHSMGSSDAFERTDRQAAETFAAAAKAAGVRRLIYLGGLGSEEEELSPHLRSRQVVGEILRASGIPTLEFRASIIIGSGSLSFEMIRSLVERLPIMITPKWVRVPAQPIAIDDVLAYLVAGLDVPDTACRIYEIGGADQVSYEGIMRAYARQRGLTLRMLTVPVLTPYVSSLWLGLITPLYARIGRKLIQSIVHSTVVHDPSAHAAFAIRPMGVEAAIAAAFRPVMRIGGETGWYAWNWLWRMRGFLDLLVGGVGVRRGRRSATDLTVGDTVDWWRVEAIDAQRLRLVAEMKVPGRAWLEFEVTGDAGGSKIRQTATFDPVGLFGRLYWYALYPLHQLVFTGMLRGIARATRSGENP